MSQCANLDAQCSIFENLIELNFSLMEMNILSRNKFVRFNTYYFDTVT